MAGTSGWEIATAIGTMGAAVAAAGAALVSNRLVRLERDRRSDERLEAKRAGVRAALRHENASMPDARGTMRREARSWLQVWNVGPAAAEGLAVSIDTERPIFDHTELPTRLDAGQRTDINTVQTIGQPMPLITLTWRDGAGCHALEVPKTYLRSDPG